MQARLCQTLHDSGKQQFPRIRNGCLLFTLKHPDGNQSVNVSYQTIQYDKKVRNNMDREEVRACKTTIHQALSEKQERPPI